MKNELLVKLINKINFDYANHFELAIAKELSFVPINMQGDAFFVAVSATSDKAKINEYIKSIFDCRIEFIFLSETNFDVLFNDFLKIFNSKYGNVHLTSESAQETEKSSDVFEEISNDIVESDNISFEDEHDSFDTMEVSSVDIDALEDVNVSMNPNIQPKAPSAVAVKPQQRRIIQPKPLSSDDDVDLTIEDDDIDDTLPEDIIEEPKSQPSVQRQAQIQQAKKAKIAAARTGARKQIKTIDQVKSPKTKRIGEILMEEGLLTEKQLTIALAEAKVLDVPLGSVLVKLGFVTIRQLKEALGAQMGLKLASADQLRALPTAISVLPEDFVRVNRVIPLSMTDKTLVVGMVNPNDTKVIDEIVYQTGLKPTIMMITHYEYENFVQTYYQTDKQETDKILEQIEKEKSAVTNEDTLWEQVEKEIQDTTGTVSKFANKIITSAIDQKASDIHIEPRSIGYVVRYRVDGALREVLKIPQKVESAVISRFKVLARMNIAEHRRAQDGSFTIKYKRMQFDFRINTLPVNGREKMVIRVLAPAVTSMEGMGHDIQIDGASKEDLEKIQYLISAPNGILLTSGPTGSGKTTTLYALLKSLNKEDVNITTIEDPVEIKLEGVNQSAVNPKAGITFATSLRAILRQDPDVILVGEIRDFETLEVAISASLTGHLVLSTVHTNSAAATVTRLIEMGAKDYLVSSTLNGVLAQRLVRKLCPDCKEAYTPTLEDARKVLSDPLEIQEFMKHKIYRAKGCEFCNNTGYKGRTAALEILVVNNDLKKLIAQRAHDVEIEEYAVKHGMKTLNVACLEHIKNGITSIDEFVRTLGLAGE